MKAEPESSRNGSDRSQADPRAFEATLLAMDAPLLAGDNRAVFRLIFELNNQIGKAAAEQKSLRPELVELQLQVNAITVSLKRGDPSKARSAVDESLRRARALGRRATPQNNL